MKKKIALSLLMSTLVLGIAACGSQTDPNPADTQAPTMEATAQPESPAESTIEPTEEPTREPASEPTVESTSDPGTEVVEGLPEDRAWIDDLYEKLIAYDIEAVFEILQDPDFEKKVEPYLYPEFSDWDDEAGYKLYTTDYKLVGVIMQDINTEEPDIFAFYSEEEDHGFVDIGHGEILIGYEMINGQAKRLCCDGMTAIYEAAGETYDVSEPGSIFIPWFN